MDDIQPEPIEENTHGIQISEQATEAEATESTGTDNPEPKEASQEPKVTFTPEQQAIFDKNIGKKVAKNHEIAQERDDLQRQLNEANAKLPQAKAPQIPDMPDPQDFYGDEVGLKAAQDARDKVISERATFDAGIQQNEKLQADQTFKQQQEKIQKQQEVISGYAKTAETFGINGEQMAKDANTVSISGLSQDIQDHLAGDAQGPLIVNFLATHMLELDTLRSMHPMDAAIHIATQIKPKLAGIKKTTKTPHPLDMDDGQGMPEKTDKRLDGVIFT